MGTWQGWVEDKLKDALTSGEQHSYYHLLPQRNPADPVDTAVRNAAAPVGNMITNAGTAISNAAPGFADEAAKFRVGPLYQPPRAAINGAPPTPTTPAGPTMEEVVQGGREAVGALRQLSSAIPKPAGEGLVLQPGDYTQGGRIYSGPPQPAAPTAIRQGEGAAMPTQAINAGNELDRWSMARGLRNNGVNVPMMSRQEMLDALVTDPRMGGIANLGTMPDNQLRDVMDRRGLNYFKMTDDQMHALWKPIEQKNIQERQKNPALFTGGDFSAGPAQPPTYKQALQTALQMFTDYAKNPGKYGPHYAQNIISAIQHLPVSEAVPEAAASEAEYKRAGAEYSRAHAGLVPSEIEKNQAIAGHYRAEGENKPFTLAPGYRAFVPSKQIGAPATEIAKGAEEKAATPGGIEHMSEGDKIMLQGAWHALSQLGEMGDPASRKMYHDMINNIYSKYQSPAAGPKPPVPGAQLLTDPETGRPVWVTPDRRKIPYSGGASGTW